MFDYLTPFRGGSKDIQSLLDPDLKAYKKSAYGRDTSGRCICHLACISLLSLLRKSYLRNNVPAGASGISQSSVNGFSYTIGFYDPVMGIISIL
jgi:hypothetical protein